MLLDLYKKNGIGINKYKISGDEVQLMKLNKLIIHFFLFLSISYSIILMKLGIRFHNFMLSPIYVECLNIVVGYLKGFLSIETLIVVRDLLRLKGNENLQE